ncbi:hypothetical protein QYS49_02815 [Marivirga salinae]|uniref:Histone deacetylase n=1 Tax=Marivirga salinarum TaxID=3059078 RepID=A0AA49GCL7_9BACT|nr:hypothetical protein [Marivirga sp. BDSF4-3]WKK76315.1 hypothetical protein QYS49_02815 [Marivirga sp. BDSF4-3]
MTDYIWYASYGSNISTERFMCYIQGGKPEGATRTYQGCVDQSPPIEQNPIKIPHELYFAKSAGVWNGGGVCFINPEKNERTETLGNMYMITRQQFMQVVQQENNTKDPIKIEFEKAQKEKSLIVRENSWYGNLLYLGDQNNAPIFTFTNENFLSTEINSPNLHYLKTIIKGLIASHQLSQSELEAYFHSKKGVDQTIIAEVINQL